MYFCGVLILDMKKLHIIILLFLGIFFMPATAMACGVKSAKQSCDQEVSCAKTTGKDCCCGTTSKSKDDKGCNGDCENALCGCSSTSTTSTVSFLSEINFQTRIFNFSTAEKVNFSNASPSISDGFSSIWLIPKIS